MNNKLRQSLLNREITLGTWIQIGHPACAEIFARAGFDWICVDLEHAVIDLETMTSIFRALNNSECVPVVRLPTNDPVWIHRSLDAGAKAIIVPMVKTAEEAERAVREAKYPPQGVRGFGYSRANLHGMNFDEYTKTANDEIAMIMQIEHIDAIPNLDAILQVDGVDGLFIGPYDLSGSMGIVGQLDHPKMIGTQEQFLTACRNHNTSAGMHVVKSNDESIQKAINMGYTLLALGLDNVFLQERAIACLKAAGR